MSSPFRGFFHNRGDRSGSSAAPAGSGAHAASAMNTVGGKADASSPEAAKGAGTASSSQLAVASKAGPKKPNPGARQQGGGWSPEEQQDYVRALGVAKLPGEEHIVRFLSDSLSVSPLPAPWATHRDAEGRVFYGNMATGETSWRHPLEETLRELAGMCRVCCSLTRDMREPCVANLREGWEAQAREEFTQWYSVHDQPSGQDYYCNSQTGQTMWEHPAEVLLPGQYMKLKAADRLLDDEYLIEILGAGTQGSTGTSLLQRTLQETGMSSTSKAMLNRSSDTHIAFKEELAQKTFELQQEQEKIAKVRADFAALVDRHEEAERRAREEADLRESMQVELEELRAQINPELAGTTKSTKADRDLVSATLQKHISTLTEEQAATIGLDSTAAAVEANSASVKEVLAYLAKASKEFAMVRAEAEKARSEIKNLSDMNEKSKKTALEATALSYERQVKLEEVERDLARIRSNVVQEAQVLSETQARLDIVEKQLLTTQEQYLEQTNSHNQTKGELIAAQIELNGYRSSGQSIEMALPRAVSDIQSQMVSACAEFDQAREEFARLAEQQRDADAGAREAESLLSASQARLQELAEKQHQRSMTLSVGSAVLRSMPASPVADIQMRLDQAVQQLEEERLRAAQAEQELQEAVEAKARIQELEERLERANSSHAHEATLLLQEEQSMSMKPEQSQSFIQNSGMLSTELDSYHDPASEGAYADELARMTTLLEEERKRVEEARADCEKLSECYLKSQEDADQANKLLEQTEARLMKVEQDLSQQTLSADDMLRSQLERVKDDLNAERTKAREAQEACDDMAARHQEALERSKIAEEERLAAEEKLAEAQKALEQRPRAPPLDSVQPEQTKDGLSSFVDVSATGGTGSAAQSTRANLAGSSMGPGPEEFAERPEEQSDQARQLAELSQRHEDALNEARESAKARDALEVKVKELQAELEQQLKAMEDAGSMEREQEAKFKKDLEDAERIRNEQRVELETNKQDLERKLNESMVASKALGEELKKTCRDLLTAHQAEEDLRSSMEAAQADLEKEKRRVQEAEDQCKAVAQSHQEALRSIEEASLDKQGLEARLQDANRQLQQTQEMLTAGADERLTKLTDALEDEKSRREELLQEKEAKESLLLQVQQKLEEAQAAARDSEAKLAAERERVEQAEKERLEFSQRHEAALAAAAAADKDLQEQLQAAKEAEAELTTREISTKALLAEEQQRAVQLDTQRQELLQNQEAAQLRLQEAEAAKAELESKLQELAEEKQRMQEALQGEAEAAQKLAERQSRTEARLAEVETQLEEERSRPTSPVAPEDLEAERQASKTRSEGLERQLAEAHIVTADVQTQLVKATEELAAARSSVDDTQKQLQLREEELARERERLQDIETQRRKLSISNHEADSIKQQLEEQLQEKTRALMASREAESSLNDRASSMEAALEKEKSRAATTEAEAKALLQAREEAEKRAVEAEESKQALQVRLEDLGTQLKSMEQMLSAGGDEKAERLQQAMQAEQKRLEELRATEARLASVERELLETSSKMKAEEALREKTQEQLRDVQGRLEEELIRPTSPAHKDLAQKQAEAQAHLEKVQAELGEARAAIKREMDLRSQAEAAQEAAELQVREARQAEAEAKARQAEADAKALEADRKASQVQAEAEALEADAKVRQAEAAEKEREAEAKAAEADAKAKQALTEASEKEREAAAKAAEAEAKAQQALADAAAHEADADAKAKQALAEAAAKAAEAEAKAQQALADAAAHEADADAKAKQALAEAAAKAAEAEAKAQQALADAAAHEADADAKAKQAKEDAEQKEREAEAKAAKAEAKAKQAQVEAAARAAEAEAKAKQAVDEAAARQADEAKAKQANALAETSKESKLEKKLEKVSTSTAQLQKEIAQTAGELRQHPDMSNKTTREKLKAVEQELKQKAIMVNDPKALMAEVQMQAAIPKRRKAKKLQQYRGKSYAHKSDVLLVGQQIQHIRSECRLSKLQAQHYNTLIEEFDSSAVVANVRLARTQDSYLRLNAVLQDEVAQLSKELELLEAERDGLLSRQQATA
eukprot:TRINITY_DN1883_c0_g1_i1.p1 TRINITY_DN1883_c0_g1~~TRINITY_DN1883_c0_g1_i1.p1  ORF type:complete len:2056 (-),score=783.00 TRINITY_DN1883_c0_g1_i1:232-6399(-)